VRRDRHRASFLSAGNVRKGKTPVRLAADAAPDAAFQASASKAFKGQTFMLVAKGDVAEVEGGDMGPVSMQIPEPELKKLSSSLTSKCNGQFTAMLDGKGPKLHHFTAGEKGADNKAQCSALEGAVCHTSAHIAENKDMQGRAIKSSVEVEGDGCLPSMCLNQGDLKVLAVFMQGKARETIPGSGVEVNLHVDCSQSGGAIADVAPDGAAASRASGPAALAHGPVDPLKSSAARLTAGAALLVAVAGLAL